MHALDRIASIRAEASAWAYPSLWLLVALLSWIRRSRAAACSFAVAAASSVLFNALFSAGSAYTSGWETDSPLNVAFEYQPLGFALANGLPLLSSLLPIVGSLLLLKRSEA
jgi:hypothetical protein